MQIIHFKKFCVPVSTGTSKCNKLLKISSDSMSDSASFLGGMSQTPSVRIFCMPLCFAHYESTYYIPVNPTSTMMTDLAMCLHFQKSRSSPNIPLNFFETNDI